MRAQRFVSLVSLWFIGSAPGTLAACGDSSGPSCTSVGQRCGAFVGSCCQGLSCDDTETGHFCFDNSSAAAGQQAAGQ